MRNEQPVRRRKTDTERQRNTVPDKKSTQKFRKQVCSGKGTKAGTAKKSTGLFVSRPEKKSSKNKTDAKKKKSSAPFFWYF